MLRGKGCATPRTLPRFHPNVRMRARWVPQRAAPRSTVLASVVGMAKNRQQEKTIATEPSVLTHTIEAVERSLFIRFSSRFRF